MRVAAIACWFASGAIASWFIIDDWPELAAYMASMAVFVVGSVISAEATERDMERRR